MKFKSDIEVQAGLKDSSGSNGTSGQILSSNGTTVSWVPAGSSVASDVQNQVKAGVAISKGQAVYVTSADGTNIIVGLASNTTEATSSKTLGLLNATVAVNGFADVVQIGKLSGLNTIGATVGDPVWLGTNGNLIYGLANKPYAPAHLVYIGVVTRVNANNGEIFVTVQNGFELKEIHDVDLVSTPPTNNEILTFEGGSVNLWKNKTIPDVLGYIPADDSAVVHKAGTETITGTKTFLNNVTYFSNNSSYSIQLSNPDDLTSVLSIGASAGTSNITSDGSLGINVGGTINAIGITPNGNTFFSNTITAPAFKTYTGTSSQFLKANGTLDSTTYVPTTRTITINGVTQSLAANQTWTVSGGIGGSGTTNYIPKFTASTTVGNSSFYDNGNVGLGTITPNGLWSGSNKTLQITGGTNISSELVQSRPSATISRFLSGTSATFGVYTADALNYEVYTSGSQRLLINTSGSVIASVDSRAPIFYDSNNTGFYGDFASTSNFNKLLLNSENTFNAATPGLTSYGLTLMGGTSDYANGVVWTWGNTNAQAGVYVQSSGAYGTKMYFATTDSFATGSKTGMSMDHNGTVLVTRSYLQSDSSLRSPIYYDSNNTGYYIDGSSGSKLNTLTLSALASDDGMIENNTGAYFHLGGWAVGRTAATAVLVNTAYRADYSDSVPWTGVTGKPSNIFYYQGFTLDANTMDSNASGFTYSVNAPFTGPIARFSTGGSYDMWVTSPYSGGGTGFAFRTRNGDTGTINPWRYPAVYDINVNGGGALYATVYYDQNDSAYYTDPASTSNLSQLQLTGASNKYLYINPGVGYEAMVRYQGGAGSSWYAGKRTSSQTVSTSDFHFYSDAAANTVFGISAAGAAIAVGNMQSPIYYDLNNTGYYVDPASTSSLNSVTINSASTVYSGLSIVRSGGGSDPYGVFGVSCPSGDNYAYIGLTRNGVIGMAMGIDTNNNFWIGSSGGGHNSVRTSTYMTLNSGGVLQTQGYIYSSTYVQAGNQMYSPMYYDANDTAYYLDPASTSNIRNTVINSTSGAIGLTVNHSNSNGVAGSKFVGATGNSYGAITAQIDISNYGTGIKMTNQNSTYASSAMQFFWNTTQVGGISINTTSTTYATSSDYRLKENVTQMTSSVERLKELSPCRFNFISDPSKVVDGFIAHEVQKIIPEAVTGKKDELDYDGLPKYQGIDQSKIVPLLTSALQEAISKIEELENRLSILENK